MRNRQRMVQVPAWVLADLFLVASVSPLQKHIPEALTIAATAAMEAAG